MGDSKVDLLVVDEAPLPPSSDSEPSQGHPETTSAPLSTERLSTSAEYDPIVTIPTPGPTPVFLPVTFDDPDEPFEPPPKSPEKGASKCCALL
jgi:hypothetical protein